MPRSGFSSRLLLSAIQGGMLGAWWGLCIVATVRASEIGWGVVALDPAKGRDVFRWDLIVHQVSTRAGLAFVHTAWDLIPLLAIAGGRIGHTATGIVLLLAGFGISKILATVSPLGGAVGVLGTSALFAASAWWWILGDTERAAIAGTMGSYLKLVPATWRGRSHQ